MKRSTLYKAIVLFIVIVPLLATIFAISMLWQRVVNLSDVILLVVSYILVALGVTVGYHRMLTHRSFTPHPVVKVIFLILGSMSLEGSALEWAATHIKHHAVADREGDPHSPLEGFFHAHVGWLFRDEVVDPNVYCRHLLKDPIVTFISRTFFLWVGLSLLIPFLIGGGVSTLAGGDFLTGAWHGFLWGGLVRIFLAHHVTWSVNSVCHTFGKREFETNDASRNEWIVGLLAMGEGWHNNHHAFPRSAFHGLHWWQFDLSAYVIRFLERIGLVQDVYRISPELIARRLEKQAQATSLEKLPELEPELVSR